MKTEIIKFRVSPEEKNYIENISSEHNFSSSEYIRRCALGRSIPSIVDQKAIDEIIKQGADLGRLGGLLKLLLGVNKDFQKVEQSEIRTVLRQIEERQAEMKKTLYTLKKKMING